MKIKTDKNIRRTAKVIEIFSHRLGEYLHLTSEAIRLGKYELSSRMLYNIIEPDPNEIEMHVGRVSRLIEEDKNDSRSCFL